MPGPHLIYFADPMCSWCYGFSPVIAAIAAQYGDTLPIRPIMGGLRPGTQETMDDETKQMIRGHWRHVQEASGQPFDYAFFDRPFFVYDTEPAARAVVVLRRPGPAAGLAALARIQRAFYAENRDVTDADTLADLADDAAALLAGLDIPAAHVVGVSLGGMVAQALAIAHPGRVLSMTSIMSQSGNPDLPGSNPAALAKLSAVAPDPALPGSIRW